MSIQTIKVAENEELDISIPKTGREEMKQFSLGTNAMSTNHSIEELVKNLSLFQLHELSESVIANLKAYYARSIMSEEENADPALEKIKDWDTRYEQLTLLQKDGSNFSSREKLEELIINFAPLLRKQYE